VTVLLHADEKVAWHIEDDPDKPFTMARRRDEPWPRHDVVFVVVDDWEWSGQEEVRWLTSARRGKPSTTFHRTISFSDLVVIEPPVAIEAIRERLPTRHRTVLDLDGILPPRGGELVLEAFLDLRPDLAATVDELRRVSLPDLPRGAGRDVWVWERDATGVLLAIADMDRRSLRRRPGTAADVPFLVGVEGARTHEQLLLDHDARHFGDWLHDDTTHVGWHVFRHGSNRLFVMNANQTPAERTLGVDLIYYNEQRHAFVLVQYKRLRKDEAGRWWYRPDGNLESELARMARVDVECDSGVMTDFRLLCTPCYIKLCSSEAILRDPEALIKGMYLARSHFEQLLEDPSLWGLGAV
jgi:hypothetical protein